MNRQNTSAAFFTLSIVPSVSCLKPPRLARRPISESGHPRPQLRCRQIVLMGAIHASRAAHSRSQNLAELRRNVDRFSSLAEEFRDDLAGHVLFISGQIQRQISLAPSEQNLRFNATAPTVRRLHDIVSRD